MLLLMALCFCTVQAQVLKVTGQVKDQAGEPLIGVNVIEKGTTNGTVTDINGQYSVSVKKCECGAQFLIHWLQDARNRFGRKESCEYYVKR